MHLFDVFLQLLPIAPLVLEERAGQLVVVPGLLGEGGPVPGAGVAGAREPVRVLQKKRT